MWNKVCEDTVESIENEVEEMQRDVDDFINECKKLCEEK